MTNGPIGTSRSKTAARPLPFRQAASFLQSSRSSVQRRMGGLGGFRTFGRLMTSVATKQVDRATRSAPLTLRHNDFEVLAWYDQRVLPTAIHSTEQFHEIGLQRCLVDGVECGERPIGRAKVRSGDLKPVCG